MYTCCVKFDSTLGWRPMCRQAETLEDLMAKIDDAYDLGHVHHVSIFADGNFLRCYWTRPTAYAAAVRAARNLLTS